MDIERLISELRNIRLNEVSGVDDPAHGEPGYLFLKRAAPPAGAWGAVVTESGRLDLLVGVDEVLKRTCAGELDCFARTVTGSVRKAIPTRLKEEYEDMRELNRLRRENKELRAVVKALKLPAGTRVQAPSGVEAEIGNDGFVKAARSRQPRTVAERLDEVLLRATGAALRHGQGASGVVELGRTGDVSRSSGDPLEEAARRTLSGETNNAVVRFE